MTTLTGISFFVEGEPKAQPRPRAFARRMGSTFAARVYDPGTAEGWKSLVATAARPHLSAEPIQGPVYLKVGFVFARPKSHFGTGRNSLMLKKSAPRAHVSTPDLDNLVKAVKDALTQIGMWKDDSQVCEEKVYKRYADVNERQGATIEISEL